MNPLEDVNPRHHLAFIKQQSGLALAALVDECEGEFRDAVLELERLSHELAELVRTW